METESLQVPKSILSDAEFVIRQAHDVQMHDSALTTLAGRIDERLREGIDDITTAFGTTGDLSRDVAMVFFETVVNFCFWGEVGHAKWMIEQESKRFGGWYGLAACFDRGVRNGMPLWDASYMANLTVTQARELFAGVADGPEIPLLEQRVQHLNEAGRYLLEKCDGSAMKLLESVNFSASRLAETVATELESFRDGALYEDKWVWILKRAQILGSDLSQLTATYPEFHMKDCDQLTAFADYRLPQILRHYGVLSYSDALAHRVDAGEHIISGSPEEVEIRMATIWACELLQQCMEQRTSADVDLGLWLLSQDMRDDPTLAPHHRTLGFFY